jgi:hypothetical protein
MDLFYHHYLDQSILRLFKLNPILLQYDIQNIYKEM